MDAPPDIPAHHDEPLLPRTRLIRFEEGVAALGLGLMLIQVCTEIVLRNFFGTSFLCGPRKWRAT